MKKVLYLSTIEVPYRTEFFNQLSKKCDLTVLYITPNQTSRNKKWCQSISAQFQIVYLSNKQYNHRIKFKILKYVLFKKYDKIIFGCVNDPSETFALLIMKLLRKKYILSLDGETWLEEKTIKAFLKRFFIKGADIYLTAGEKTLEGLKKIVKNKERIFSYYFSPLSNQILKEHQKHMNKNETNQILVVGRYCKEKGLDIAIEVALQTPQLNYKFIGIGNMYDEFMKYLESMGNPKNIQVIPFLQSEELYKEYQKCKMFVLPSRKECWGLVINEASSFGVPIVSTTGSGAALEFLKDDYSMFLAEANNVVDLKKKIENLLNYDKIDVYRKYLIKKSSKYSIEKMVDVHIKVINMK